jgi:uncharacterized membrane protein (Fun14 family)
MQKSDTMSATISPLVYQLGIGGIGGFIAGYALKKISKLVAIVIGLFIIALIYLSVKGIISINYGALWNALSGWMGSASQAVSWFVGAVSLLPFMGSFVAGLLLGFKLG